SLRPILGSEFRVLGSAFRVLGSEFSVSGAAGCWAVLGWALSLSPWSGAVAADSRMSLAARRRTEAGVLGSDTRVRMASIAIAARAASWEFACFISIIR